MDPSTPDYEPYPLLFDFPLVERMHNLFEYEGVDNSKDFVIRLGPNRLLHWILVHKAIVEAGSPVLHEIIKSHESPAFTKYDLPYLSLYKLDQRYAEVNDMANFKRMIEFMYTDEIKSFEKKDLKPLLRLSNLFEMTRLETYCTLHLAKMADSTTSSSSSSSSSTSSASSFEHGSRDWVVVNNPEWDSESRPLLGITSNSPTSPRRSTCCSVLTASNQSKLTLSITPKLKSLLPDIHTSKSTIQVDPCHPGPFSSTTAIPTTSSNSQIKEELMVEVKAELKQQLVASLQQKFLKELKENMMDEIQEELTNELREEIKDELKDELRDDIIAELKESLSQEIQDELDSEIRVELTRNIKEELMKNLTSSIKSDWTEDGEFMSKLKDEITATLKEELVEKFESLTDSIKSDLTEDDEFLGSLKREITDTLKIEMTSELMEEDGELKDQILSHLKITIQSDPELSENIKNAIENEFMDDGYYEIKTELKVKLEKVVFEELEKKLKDQMDDEIMGDSKFKQDLIQDCKTTLTQRVQTEVLGKIKDDLVQELRNELSDEVANAIRHDLY